MVGTCESIAEERIGRRMFETKEYGENKLDDQEERGWRG